MKFKKSSINKPKLHQVVIVGGGAGGLELATRLGDNWVVRVRLKLP
jgi:NADH dehydrogenase FAD-containing subunit